MRKIEKLVFNYDPTQEDLEQYFNSCDFKNIGHQHDEVLDVIIRLFGSDEWSWTSVVSDGEVIAMIPFPCDNGYRVSLKRSLFGEENTAAFILFLALSLIHSEDDESTPYAQDFIDNLDKKSCLILEPAFDMINQTLGIDMGSLFSKITGNHC